GTPLPIWACEKCGTKTGAFSRKRILELAVETPDGRNFELHRPWIDRVVLKCPSCGGWAVREPFVLDTWHNSGASPYASFTDAEFKRLVPVGFLTEGIDQTRGWAYTLLLLNVILTGKPRSPYRKFLFQGHVLDQNGVKMSKSLGNVIQGLDLLRNNSVDVLRLYILSKASPPDSASLDLNEMGGRPYQVINTLYHLHLYLQQNGAVDGYDAAKNSLGWATKRKLLTTVDRWMLSKLTAAEDRVVESYAAAAFNDAAKAIEELVITHLSQTYIRLVRNELWKDEPKERGRRLAIYAVLGEGLRTSDVLLHPISPFATEFLYQEVFAGKKSWKSPLLALGRSKRAKGASSAAESIVDLALIAEEACNSARTRAKLKRRWPLRSATLLVPARSVKIASRSRGTAALLCNVKQVLIVTSASKFPASFLLRPNSSRVGALFKERTRDVLAATGPLEGAAALKAYLSSKPLKVTTQSGVVEVPVSAFELVTTPGEGYEVAERGGMFVAITKERDPKLVAEGLVRDVARRLQALRKEKGFVPTAMLRSASVAGLEDEDLELLKPLSKEIAFLVRVKKVELAKEKAAEGDWAQSDLDGRPVYLRVG
ncbi:MAG TPA: class I tRNA ligase family protein, partial [Nitrososphaerales archaeon]